LRKVLAMAELDEWLVEVEDALTDGWSAFLSAGWLQRVYRDYGPISLAELRPLAESEEARLTESADARLELARTLLAKVLADVEAAGLPRPAVELDLDEWKALTIWITFTPDGGDPSGGNCDGTTFFGDVPAEMLGWLAENVHEVTMEGDQTHCAVWPTCAMHSLGGHVRDVDRVAAWWCSADGGHVIAPIGELAATLP
jgi:hypothetical protein